MKRTAPLPKELDARIIARLNTSDFDRTASGLAYELREDISVVMERLKALKASGQVQSNNPFGPNRAEYFWVNNPVPGASK